MLSRTASTRAWRTTRIRSNRPTLSAGTGLKSRTCWASALPTISLIRRDARTGALLESRPSTSPDTPRARMPITVMNTAITASTVTLTARRDAGSRRIVITSRSMHQVDVARGATQYDGNPAVSDGGDQVSLRQRLNVGGRADVDGAAGALQIDSTSEGWIEPQSHVAGFGADVGP